MPKNLGDDAYAYTAAIVEDLKSDFRVVAESHRSLSDEVTGLRREVGTMKKDISELKIGQSLIRDDIAVMKQDISELKDKMTSVEVDIKEINIFSAPQMTYYNSKVFAILYCAFPAPVAPPKHNGHRLP